jgi:hypothetical protein
MTVDEKDWRLRGQEKYLRGLSWTRRPYTAYRPGWDHDHCEFCSAKLMGVRAPDVLDEGYETKGGYTWVCPPCFEDFREMFEWTVTSST